jgi:hypothetical protein
MSPDENATSPRARKRLAAGTAMTAGNLVRYALEFVASESARERSLG